MFEKFHRVVHVSRKGVEMSERSVITPVKANGKGAKLQVQPTLRGATIAYMCAQDSLHCFCRVVTIAWLLYTRAVAVLDNFHL